MKKILFLDIDGVLNSEETLKHYTRGDSQIDPYLTLLVRRIIEATGCEVVLSSSWRKGERTREEARNAVPFTDVTPSCCTGIRGAEIYQYMNRRFSHEERQNLRYAILDDDGDMLLWQKDSFFQTSFKTGITEEIVEKVIAHLNK